MIHKIRLIFLLPGHQQVTKRASEYNFVSELLRPSESLRLSNQGQI